MCDRRSNASVKRGRELNGREKARSFRVERGCEPNRGKKMEIEIYSIVFGKEAEIVLIVSRIIHSKELKG